MKKTILLSSLVISFLSFKAQTNKALWKEINENQIPVTGKRDIIPKNIKHFIQI